MRYILFVGLISILSVSCSSSSENQPMEEDNTVLIINGITNKQNQSELQEYLDNIMKVFKENGGKPIARYKTIEQMAGEDSPEMIAIVGFSDKQAIKDMLNGEEFKALSKVRARVFNKLNLMICEGI